MILENYLKKSRRQTLLCGSTAANSWQLASIFSSAVFSDPSGLAGASRARIASRSVHSSFTTTSIALIVRVTFEFGPRLADLNSHTCDDRAWIRIVLYWFDCNLEHSSRWFQGELRELVYCVAQARIMYRRITWWHLCGSNKISGSMRQTMQNIQTSANSAG